MVLDLWHWGVFVHKCGVFDCKEFYKKERRKYHYGSGSWSAIVVLLCAKKETGLVKCVFNFLNY